MSRIHWRSWRCGLVVAAASLAVPLTSPEARGANQGWDGTRPISYQAQKDLFYNYYVGPGPSGAVAQMYVSPLPVPAFVGHTYVTYQPFMPHEYLWAHQRSYYTYNEGAGWTRTNVRYGTGCCWGRRGLPNPERSPYLGTYNGLKHGFPF
jgi:hypothetical protein